MASGYVDPRLLKHAMRSLSGAPLPIAATRKRSSRSSLQPDSRLGLRLPMAPSPIQPPMRPKKHADFFQTAQPGPDISIGSAPISVIRVQPKAGVPT